MNVYDFDKTIYDGDSTQDFIFFTIRRHPTVLINLPCTAYAFFLYTIKKYTKTQFKEKMYGLLKYVPDVDTEVNIFWNTHVDKIKKWYFQQKCNDDLIISASPEFLLSPVCKKLGIKMMASVVDKKTGRYSGKNCHGKEKVRRFYEKYPKSVIEQFYSDSYSDSPLAEISKKAFLVNGDKLANWVKK